MEPQKPVPEHSMQAGSNQRENSRRTCSVAEIILLPNEGLWLADLQPHYRGRTGEGDGYQ